LTLAAIVTLVDAINGEATLAARAEARRQVAVADRLVVSKTDLVAPGEGAARLARLRENLRGLNPRASLFDAAGEFSVEDFLAAGEADRGASDAPSEAPSRFRAEAAHGPAIGAQSLRWPTPIEWRAAAQFADLLKAQFGARLLRVKGLIALADDPGKPLLIQGAQHVFSPPRRLPAWPDADRATRLVVIGEGLAPGEVERFWAALVGAPAIDQPDRAALVENPLSPRPGGLLA